MKFKFTWSRFAVSLSVVIIIGWACQRTGFLTDAGRSAVAVDHVGGSAPPKASERSERRQEDVDVARLALAGKRRELKVVLQSEGRNSHDQIRAYLNQLRDIGISSPVHFARAAMELIRHVEDPEDRWRLSMEFLSDEERGSYMGIILGRETWRDPSQLKWMKQACMAETSAEARVEISDHLLRGMVHAGNFGSAGEWLDFLESSEMLYAVGAVPDMFDRAPPAIDVVGKYADSLARIEKDESRAAAAFRLLGHLHERSMTPKERVNFAHEHGLILKGSATALVSGAQSEEERYEYIDAFKSFRMDVDLTHAYGQLGSEQGQREGFESVLEMVKSVPESHQNRFLKKGLMMAYSRENRERFIRYAQTLPDQTSKEAYLTALADALVFKDPNGAAQLASDLPPSARRDSILKQANERLNR